MQSNPLSAQIVPIKPFRKSLSQPATFPGGLYLATIYVAPFAAFAFPIPTRFVLGQMHWAPTVS